VAGEPGYGSATKAEVFGENVAGTNRQTAAP
jgi:hypothetical protein